MSVTVSGNINGPNKGSIGPKPHRVELTKKRGTRE